MLPCRIPDSLSAGRWWRLRRVAISPVVVDKQIMLFAPHHARERLSLNVTQVIRHGERADSVVEVVGFISSALNNVVEVLFIEVRLSLLGEAEPNDWIIISSQIIAGRKLHYSPAHSPGGTPPASLNLNQAADFVPLCAGFTTPFFPSTMCR